MIHKFELDGTRILLDVNSGAVHVFDDVAWDLVGDYAEGQRQDVIAKWASKYSPEIINETLDELDILRSEGNLWAEDNTMQEYALPEQPILKSLCLHVAHDCNLRCGYCFAGEGHFGGDRTLMDVETGKAGIDLLLEKSQGRRNCEIDFFGGEPLLNFKVVQELVEYGRAKAKEKGKVIKFTLTTNAVLLDDKITQWLNANDISVVLSLDGRQGINDQMRTYIDGTGCYDDIVPNIKQFVDSRDNEGYYVRGTYTRHNVDFSQDVQHMVELGFKHVSVEPVVGPEQEAYALQEEQIPVLQGEYEKLTKYFLAREEQGQPFTFFHFNLDLTGGPCLPKRLSGCGAGHEYLAVSPEGKLYPCHQFVGKEDFLVGDVFTKEINYSLAKRFQQAHVYNKPACNNCWAKFYCSGGCHANAHGANQDILQPYALGCELEKKRLECAIYIQVKKAGLA